MDIMHDENTRKFYCIVDGLESVMEYRKAGENTLNFYHTYVPPKLRGQQIAHSILTEATKYALANNFTVIPSYPYAHWFFKRHPEYASIVKSP